MRWAPVRGHDGVYEVSDEGVVRRVAPGRHTRPGLLLKPHMTPNGYLMVKLLSPKHDGSWTMRGLHRVVAEAFLGPCPDGIEVNHKDLNKLNNRLENLEFMTRKQNARHALENGGYRCGTKMKNAKLTEEVVAKLREAGIRRGMWSQTARELGVARTTLRHAVRSKTWNHVK